MPLSQSWDLVLQLLTLPQLLPPAALAAADWAPADTSQCSHTLEHAVVAGLSSPPWPKRGQNVSSSRDPHNPAAVGEGERACCSFQSTSGPDAARAAS